MPERRADFQRVQYGFAAYIRDPSRNPPPDDVAPVRMRMYRELFFNNIESFIGAGFPVLKSILDGERWLELVGDFFRRHRCRTPFFVEIAEEFLDYLQNERGERPDDPPFLLELAHYEWVELALAVADGSVPKYADELGADPLIRVVALSALAWPLAYRFPVHRLCPEFQPAEPEAEPACLVVYRDRTDAVKFLEVNTVTFRLLETLRETGPRRGADLLRHLADRLQYPDPAILLAHGAEILQGLGNRGVIELS